MSELAENYVDWQLKLLRPLLISSFDHGFKHGVESVVEDVPKAPQAPATTTQEQVAAWRQESDAR